MKLSVYSVFDVKADAFNAPFYFSTNGQAIRAFANLASDKDTSVGRNPEDFKLVKIGVFDDNTGIIESVTFESLGFATEYVSKAG